MAHEVDTMAYSGEVPWHGLGVRVSNDLTPAEMMKEARVDWEVHEAPLHAEYKGEITLTDQKALIRADTGHILSCVGKNWNTTQNADAFNFFNEYVQAGDMEMHTAGSLKGGQIVWVLAKIKESFELFGGDQVDSFLLFSNPHLYGVSIDVRFTPIRVVCNNTLTFALEKEAKRSVRVSHSVEFDPEIVKETLGLAKEKFASYREMAEFLGSKRYTNESLIDYYNEVFPHSSMEIQEKDEAVERMSNNGKRCLRVIESQPGAEYAPGTWWQAFNSVTYLTDHIHGRTAENRLHSQWFGSNQTRKVFAAEKAKEYALAA